MHRLLWGLHTVRRYTLLLVVVLLYAGAAGLACEDGDTLAGAPGIGDPYVPSAGNGGYDVSHYDIALDFEPAQGSIQATAVVQATATQALSSFNLDLVGLEVEAVSVDGERAEYRRDRDELIVVSPRMLQPGEEFSTKIAYSGAPRALRDAESFMVGWQQVGDYVYTLDEPLGAATWYPANDHPSDKATYTFRLTVPPPHVGVANGVLVETRDEGTTRTFVWEMRQPLASYLATVGFGPYVLEEGVSPSGVAIRDYFANEIVDDAEPLFAGTAAVLEHFQALFGGYPFEAYGVVVPLADIGAAMENQTLSLFGADVVRRISSDSTVRDVFLAHELAHQWYGNSVTITRWADIWLNEGFATYASWLWLEHDRGPQLMTRMVEESLEMLRSRSYPLLTDPGIDGLFSANVYRRGALTLHALRLTVGDEVFLSILREWAARYRYGNATTVDFMSLAHELASGTPAADLDALFNAWLFQKELPRLPGEAP